MGALHSGHLQLLKQARAVCDVVVVSIFVNPLQFNNPEDLARYPSLPEQDEELLRTENTDLLYRPSSADFYSTPSVLEMDFGPVGAGLEGKMRPGHFSGVGIVVARLFHLVSPDKAFFGAKDLQQVAIIKTLVRDLDFQIEIVTCPTYREENGLAMSSRNARLSADGRQLASNIFTSLKLAEAELTSGLEKSKAKAISFLGTIPEIQLEYLEWVDIDTMEILTDSSSPSHKKSVCIAAWIEGVRLIDNFIPEV